MLCFYLYKLQQMNYLTLLIQKNTDLDEQVGADVWVDQKAPGRSSLWFRKQLSTIYS